MIGSFVIVGSQPSNQILVEKMKRLLTPMPAQIHVTEDTDEQVFIMELRLLGARCSISYEKMEAASEDSPWGTLQ